MHCGKVKAERRARISLQRGVQGRKQGYSQPLFVLPAAQDTQRREVIWEARNEKCSSLKIFVSISFSLTRKYLLWQFGAIWEQNIIILYTYITIYNK